MTPPHVSEAPSELVVCSLEAWDDVWRRNQFLVRELMRRDPALGVLFVEPPLDAVHSVRHRRRLGPTGLSPIADRLWRLRPLKLLPRVAGPFADASLRRQVLRAAALLGFSRPTLWINDVNYAPLVETGWPVLYDVTDDWLLAPTNARELARTRRCEDILLRRAGEVVVCSPALAASRGARRRVHLVPNAVDVDHFRSHRPRPIDLPPAPTAVYVGTLHEQRFDVALCDELAARHGQLAVVLVGPNALAPASVARLKARRNVHLLGPRPYDDVPGYLQHADVVVVPHVVTPFTESLDPIKAYECLTLDAPTVATPIAGFRDLSGQLHVVTRDAFVDTVGAALANRATPRTGADLPAWSLRAEQFGAALDRAGHRPRSGPPK